MSALVRIVTTGLTVVVAGWAGLAAGERGMTFDALKDVARTRAASLLGHQAAVTSPIASTGPVIYWRHPDGLAEWSAAPRQTGDGRAFVPVRASEDTSFDAPPKAASASGLERRVLYYRNPMGLPDTSPVPKRDSMGMDYIPVYEGDETNDGSVTISPGKLQQTGVRTAEAMMAPLALTLRAPGIIALDERNVSVIALRADAFIETVADVTTGSRIREGDPLVTLYSPEIARATAQFVSDLRADPRLGAGGRRRLENLGVPPEVIDQIAANGVATVSIPLSAPRDGVVLERMAIEGMMSKAGETLFRIADMSTVWVIADVPESALMDVTPGAEVRVSFHGLQGAPLIGRVETVYPEVDPATRTAKLRIDLPNADGRLLANMFAEVEIAIGGAPVVQVPEGAVIDSGDRQVVILDLGEGRFRPQDVTVGRRGGGAVEIIAGVHAGDRVVSAATFLIDAESNLNAALAALVAAEGQQ